jgi:hypothetical protein
LEDGRSRIEDEGWQVREEEVDFVVTFAKNGRMSTVTTISADVMARLQEAADKAARGVRDPDEMRRACERMDRLREKIFQRHGLLDIAVPAIRDLRDS